jgi:single-stranded DNA-binding protein
MTKPYFDNRHIKGKVTKDSEVRKGNQGDFTTFSIAINYSEKNGDKWDKIHCEFINCNYSGALKLNKGDSVEVKGFMTYRSYQGKVYNAFKVQEVIGADTKQDYDTQNYEGVQDFSDDIPF